MGVRPRHRLTTVPAAGRSLAAVLLLALAGCGAAAHSPVSDPAAHRVTRAPARHVAASARRRRVVHLTLPAHPAPRSVHVAILTYHRVHVFATEYTKSIPDETVEPAVFAAEMRGLRRAGFHTVSQLQLFRALFRGARLPSRPVLISVDDGYVDDVKQILPVLKAEHMVATFYVITGRIHEKGFLNATEIRRLDGAGMDVGAHTRTHVPLAALPAAAARLQIAGSRRDLERILGHPVYWFAYPYGSTDAAVTAEVRRAGFVLAATTSGGTAESSLAPLALPRLHVGRSAGPATVVALARGAGRAMGGGD